MFGRVLTEGVNPIAEATFHAIAATVAVGSGTATYS
jgi:hypothetical protein